MRKKIINFLFIFQILLLTSCGTIFQKEYTITYKTSYGITPEQKIVKEGTFLTSEFLPVLEDDGYEFICWTYEGNELCEDKYKVVKDITLVAKWEKLCKVTFETNGGLKIDSITIKNYEIIYNTYKTDRQCYLFDGWYTDEKLTNPFDFPAVITDDLILYAKWNSNHTYSNFEIIKEPTCEENGEKQGFCSTCNKIVNEEIKALGHNYGDWIIVTPVICFGIQDGLKKRICSICNNEETEVIKSGPHQGKYKCSNCKEFFVSICELDTEYTDSEGLTVKMNSITRTKDEGYIAYRIDYTVKNTVPDSRILPGTFDICFSNDKTEMQTGFFNYLYYGDEETRSFTWKILRSEDPVVFRYSQSFSSNGTPLYWAVPEN